MKSSERQKIRMRERRRELELKGLCICCGKNTSLPKQKYCLWCAEKRRTNARIRLKTTQAKVLEMYGKTCACCGEDNAGFLTIDHINNDGWKERKPNGSSLTSSEMIYRRLLKKKRDDIQILCYNCNCAKQRLGFCPHRPAETITRRVRGARSKGF